VETTRVRRSSLQELLPSMTLDRIAFPVLDVFERLSPSASTVTMDITFLDEGMRIVRDEEGRRFVYTKADD
jgi:hypothetical protein